MTRGCATACSVRMPKPYLFENSLVETNVDTSAQKTRITHALQPVRPMFHDHCENNGLRSVNNRCTMCNVGLNHSISVSQICFFRSLCSYQITPRNHHANIGRNEFAVDCILPCLAFGGSVYLDCSTIAQQHPLSLHIDTNSV